MAEDPTRRFPSCAALITAVEGRALRDRPAVAAAPATLAAPWIPVRSGWSAPSSGPAPVGGVRGLPDETMPPCPYPGLRSFERADAAWFHGRDRMVTDLLIRLAEQVRHGDPVVLVGASGSGKSSLLRAGLLPALDTGDPAGDPATTRPPRTRGAAAPRRKTQLVCTPGADPIGALAAAIAPLAASPPVSWRGDPAGAVRVSASGAAGWPVPARARPVLVVDQFEELFSHEVPDADRLAFATALASAAPALVLQLAGAGRPGRAVRRPRPAAARAGHAGVPGAVERDRAAAGDRDAGAGRVAWRSSRACRSA